MWAAQFYGFEEPNRWMTSGGLGTMGYGLPAAMGVQVAHPDSLVIDIAGDASVLMTMQEMSTAVQHDLPVKIFILNNQYMGMVRQWQQLLHGNRISHSYMESLPDFVKLAEAYGCVGIRAEHPAELDDAIAEMIRVKRPVIFDCRVANLENCFPMIPSGKAHNEMLLPGRGDGGKRRRGGRCQRPRDGVRGGKKDMNKMSPTPKAEPPLTPPASAYFMEERHDPKETHTLAVLVDNEPGVLARVIGLFSGRGYNIESLTVSETQHEQHLSRITIVTTGTRAVLEQIKNQLDRLVSVHSVTDLTNLAPRAEPGKAARARAGAGQGGRHRRKADRGAAPCRRFQGGGGRRHDRALHLRADRPHLEDRAVHRHHGRRWAWSRCAAPASPRWDAARRGCSANGAVWRLVPLSSLSDAILHGAWTEAMAYTSLIRRSDGRFARWHETASGREAELLK